MLGCALKWLGGDLKTHIQILLVGLSLVFSVPASAQTLEALEREQQALFDTTSPSVVFIAIDKGFGSGFFVAKNLVLTNRHVVGDQKEVSLIVRGGKRSRGKVIARSTEIDLALIRTTVEGVPLHLTPSSGVRVGSWVGAIGHGEGGVWTFTTGMVSNMYNRPGQPALIQTQIPINHGNSGGPILTRTGEVVAVATAKSRRGENLNFAIPVELAVSEFEELRKECATCLKINTYEGAQVFLGGRLIGTGPLVVLPVAKGKHELMIIHGSISKKKMLQVPGRLRVDLK